MRYKIIEYEKDIETIPPVISLDTEYTELNIRKATLLSISVGLNYNLTYIFKNLDLIKLFLNKVELVFTWNGVVDWYMLNKSGFELNKNIIIDAMLMEHLVDERLNHSLGEFALREYQDNYKKEFWGKYDNYQDASENDALEYEMKDGVYTYRAGHRYLQILKDKHELIKHVHSLQWALFDTEVAGIKVNIDLMKKTKQDMYNKISEYLPKLRKEFDDHCKVWEMQKWAENISKYKTDKGRQLAKKPEFSFSSDKQISWLLYESLGLEPKSKTKKGNPSTNYDAIKELTQENPILETLLNYKETKSVYSTFVEGMLERVDKNRIYPGFFINGTATGRISHVNPNMGNLPREGVIRNFFIPDEDNVIVGADYSQLEVVIEANLTEDKQLLKIILEGASKHDITAEGLGLPRDTAKTLNFALQYGAGIRKISKMLDISLKDAQDVFNKYWELYSGVKALKDQTAREVNDKNQITNMWGRIRHFEHPRNEFEQAKNERMAYNFLIQGAGADMTNMATYIVYKNFLNKKLGRLWFSVHDEIITECKQPLIEEAKSTILKSMEEPNEYLNLKYRVDAKLYGPLPCWSKG